MITATPGLGHVGDHGPDGTDCDLRRQVRPVVAMCYDLATPVRRNTLGDTQEVPTWESTRNWAFAR